MQLVGFACIVQARMPGQLTAWANLSTSGNYCTLSVLPPAVVIPANQATLTGNIIDMISWQISLGNGVSNNSGFLLFQLQGADGVFRTVRFPPAITLFNLLVTSGTFYCRTYGAQVNVPNTLTTTGTFPLLTLSANVISI